MSRTIYTLPELTDGQGYSCDQCGGENIKPKLTKNMVRLETSAAGEFMSGQYEEFYACFCGGDLSVWCNKADDFIELDVKHYEQTGYKNATLATVLEMAD